MSNINYRPDIDGLRALAVIGVLFFHVGLGLPGGFVGVDVFFVISGFLITSIIVKDIKDASFSMSQFWVRRIRRILPAASVMVSLVLLFGGLFLSPVEWVTMAHSAIAQACIMANIYLYKNIGYFSGNSKYELLLHTWSLAVEEQFYLFFPFTLYLVYRYWKPRVFFVLIISALASFCLSIYWMKYHQSAAFFLLPTRAWELMAGTLIAITQLNFTVRRCPAEFLSSVGFIMVLAAMCFYSRATPFPGLNALLPVAGTTFVIAGNKDRLTFIGRMLSQKPIIFVGLISYSLYLWHWPVIVISNLMMTNLNTLAKFLVVAISFLLAILSWKFIETPFRNKMYLRSKTSVFVFGLTVSLVIMNLGMTIVKINGLPSRIDEKYRLMAEDISWNGSEYSNYPQGVPLGSTRLSTGGLAEINDSSVDFVLWGDSHGMAIANLIDKLSARYSLNGWAFLTGGITPVTGTVRLENNSLERIRIMQTKENILNELILHRVKNVILVSRWSACCERMNNTELADNPAVDPNRMMIVDHTDDKPTPESSADVLRHHLSEMVQRLTDAGITVWILKQVPEADSNCIAREFYISKCFPSMNTLKQVSTSFESHKARQARVNVVLDDMVKGKVNMIDPSEYFYPTNRNLVIYSERSYYRDNNHLTRYGAEKFLTPVLLPLFKKIAEEKTQHKQGYSHSLSMVNP